MMNTGEIPRSRMERNEALIDADYGDTYIPEDRIQSQAYKQLLLGYPDSDVEQEFRVTDSTGKGARYADIVVHEDDIAIECKSTDKLTNSRGFSQALDYGTQGYSPYLCSDIRAVSKRVIKQVLQTDIGLMATSVHVSGLPDLMVVLKSVSVPDDIQIVKPKTIFRKYKYGISDEMNLEGSYRNSSMRRDILPEC